MISNYARMTAAGAIVGLAAACQPTTAAQTISANSDLDAVELSRLDDNNSGTIDTMEATDTAEAAARAGNAVPEPQVVDVQDDG